MKRAIPIILSVLVCVTGLFAVDTGDTRMLTQPAISQNHIVFSYAQDLWAADTNGENVRRLTAHDGVEGGPVFSPDGKFIAFTGVYDGNVDVYIIPVEGGVPKRLTYHPGEDVARGFTPDGKHVLFISNRYSFSRRISQPFTVSVNGGNPTQIPIHRVNKAAYSPDGKYLAYTPVREVFGEWKNYRGGTVSRIWIYSFGDQSVVEVPQPEGRCNDTDPMWIGGNVYFRSDREGEFNLYKYEPGTKAVKRLTDFTDFPVLTCSAGNGKIIFEQAGYLHLLDPGTKKIDRLKIGVAADLKDLRRRYAKNPRFYRNAHISPSGARAVFEYRGEIITVPAKKGDIRNLTDTPGTHERHPVWSPDGKSIAYFSDATGEYQLHVVPQDGKGKAKVFKIKGHGFYAFPVWSPDSKKIAYFDNSKSVYWINLQNGDSKKIGGDAIYEPGQFPFYHVSWSPDSRWIAYTLNNTAMFRTVYIYSIDNDKSYPVSDGLSEAAEPVFDASGKYLYFMASTDAGPVKHWFAMSNADMEMVSSIYIAVLDKTLPSPLAKESDEEKGEEKKAEKKEKIGKKAGKKGKEKAKKEEKKTVIHPDGIQMRILALPAPAGNYFGLSAGKAGTLYYLEAPRGLYPAHPKTQLKMFSLEEREEKTLSGGVNDFWISADKKKILYRSGMRFALTNLGPKLKPGEGMLKLKDVRVQIDPLKEWPQIFDEAWRINRDYFYDPNFHGCDWKAMKEKYSVFLPHLSCRDDLNRLIEWMCSELSVGHHRGGGGDFNRDIESVPGGLLGADYAVENGHYRFKKIYGGLNWNPELRSPLTEPGVNVNEGDYLLEVNGKKVLPSENLFKHFEQTAEKIVELKVGPNPNGAGARVVKVSPIARESRLRSRAWVEGNLKKVEKATNGRVAYVWVPNTANLGHEYFKRYFFPQTGKDAIIIDERYNGGGQVADYYIDILRRPYNCSWAFRYGKDLHSPTGSILGPKVMLINEFAGSGGDLLPWMFRKFKLGKLIGKRTWGGLVGVLGYPNLLDGGFVTAPNIGFWTEDEGFSVENEGVPPDIEVEEFPKDMINGGDPQLDKAIQVIMDQLKKNPPKKRKRPPFPIRVRK